ncbi:hypothetical protein RGUI_1717 [Rhodovulum sp. P5]|uniref:DUF3168 domain-containing protein n=1 Tax=Rhodovulum sp. P5 TaxID=1564506 RepID=UPI0009C3779B|nr:DUF3168 domain-containing protein [Rhodovulum sp. P5]ARE39858.1 hypothetical protein RGUI_1717 [Rhodovulum sp. P5]
MIDASLDLQKALRARLVASTEVLGQVPAAHILDRNSRPEVFPCILIGESQSLAGAGLSRIRQELHSDLHIWAEEPGLAISKTIAGAIRAALGEGPWSLDHHHVADLYIQQVRFLRDPDGIHSHGVMTLRAHLVEVS